MKIHSTKIKVILGITFAFGVALAFFFVALSKCFLWFKLPNDVLWGISVLSVMLLFLCLMVIEEDSRAGGILLVAISLPMLIHFSDYMLIKDWALIIGIVGGASLDLLAILKGRFDILANASKIVISGFFLFFIYYLWRCYSFGVDIGLIIGALILLIGTYVGLLCVIRGVKVGNVFFVGEPESGKTVASACFYTHITRKMLGRLSYLIQIGGSKQLRMGTMFDTLNSGEWIKGTEPDEIRLIGMEGKKWGITPVKTAVMDYSGGYLKMEDIPDSLRRYKLDMLEKEVIDAFPEDSKPLTPIGTYDFMEWLKDAQEEGRISLSADIIKNIILCSICRNLREAGKIVFIVDGKEVKKYIDEEHNNLAEYFDTCVGIMNQLGSNKKYTLAVTKTDELDNSLGIDRGKMKEEEVEKKIYNKLGGQKGLPTFNDIINKALNINFYAICIETYEKEGKRKPIPNLHIWGYDNLARWIF